MSMLSEPSFAIVTEDNSEAIELFNLNNMKGYITFSNNADEVVTIEIKIKEIKDVFNCFNNKLLDTYISYSYEKEFIEKSFFFFEKKYSKKIDVESGFYSKDFYSSYAPYGMLPLNVVKATKEESIIFYFENRDESNKYSKCFVA